MKIDHNSRKSLTRLLLVTVSFLSIYLWAPSQNTWAKDKDIEIVSMNLRWYGSKKFPPHNDEERDQHLPLFFKTYYKTVDLFLFQEITDPLRLESTLGRPYKCLSTRHRGSSYQYVVSCYNTKTLKPILASKETFHPDRVFDISFGIFGLRNALHIPFEFIKDKSKIIHSVNLHLRASPQHSQFRVQQVASLFDQLVAKDLHLEKGLIIGGDFNSFHKDTTKQSKDDIYLFFDEADQRGLALYTEFAYPSHLSSGKNRYFDYLMVTTPHWLNTYEMFVACSDHASPQKDSYENPRYYKAHISDHCPISLKVPLKDL